MPKKIEKLITINYKVPQHRLMRCVYKITFGHRFYIGKTSFLARRVAQHQNGINKAMLQYSELINAGEDKQTQEPFFRYYKDIARFLLENPNIKYGTVEVVRRAVTQMELFIHEREILGTLCGNRDCFNRSFSSASPRVRGNVNTGNWFVKKRKKIDKNDLFYYHSSDPKQLYSSKESISSVLKRIRSNQ